MSEDIMGDILKVIHFGSIGFLALSFMFFGPDVTFVAIIILIFVAAVIPGPLAEQMTFSVNVPVLKAFFSWGPKESGGVMLMTLQFWFPALFPGYILTQGAIMTFMLVGFDLMGFKGILLALIYAFAMAPISTIFKGVFLPWVERTSGAEQAAKALDSYAAFENLMAGFSTALAVFGTMWVIAMVLHSINHPITKIIAVVIRFIVLWPIVLAPHFFPGPACLDTATCQAIDSFCNSNIVAKYIGFLFCFSNTGAAFNNITIFGTELLGVYFALIMVALDVIALLTSPGILEQIMESFKGISE